MVVELIILVYRNVVLGVTISPDEQKQKQHVPIKSQFFRPWKHEPRVRAASSLWRDAFLSAVPPHLYLRTSAEPLFASSAFRPIERHSPVRSITALSHSSSRIPWPIVAETAVTCFNPLIVG